MKKINLTCPLSPGRRLLVTGLFLFLTTGFASGANYAAGSLIIPMDVQYQNYGMWRAYGLVYNLLSNGVPVHWAIGQGKSWNGADFTASAQDLRTGAGIGSYTYSGGPFIIDQADAARAIPLIQAWWARYANQPAIHQTTADFTARVDIILNNPPRIANEEINSGITISYYNAAGIPDMDGNPWSSSSRNLLNQTEIAGGALFTYGTCSARNFDVFVTPHNSGYSYSLTDPADIGTRTYAALDYFVMQGGGWMALCHSILSNENAIAALYKSGSPAVRALFTAPAAGEGGFLTKNGFSDISNKSGTWTVTRPELPLAQGVATTAIQALPGGSVQNWPVSSVEYWSETERVAHFLNTDVEYDWAINGVAHNGAGAGKMTCLGGHSYSTSLPYSGNYEAPYLRFFYNGLFFNGAAVAKLTLVASPGSAGQSTTTPVSLQLRNTGASVASQVKNVKVILPVGVTYVSTTGQQPDSQTGGGTEPLVLTWNSLPDVNANDLALTVNVTVNFAIKGTAKIADFEAAFGDVYLEKFNLKSCHSVQVTAVPVPDITKTPPSQGPLYRGQTALWTLTYRNAGDEPLYNGVVEDILPAAFTFRSAIPSPASIVPLPDGTTRVRWNVGTLAAQSAPQTITLRVYTGGVPGEYTNYATLSGQDAAGNSYTDLSNGAVVIIQALDIKVNKSVDIPATDVTTPGATLTYTVRPLYEGASLLTNVLIADPVPAFTSYVTNSATAGGQAGFIPLPAQSGSSEEGTGTLTTSITVTGPSLLAEGGTTTVTMQLTNNSGSAITTIVPTLVDSRNGKPFSPSTSGFSLNNGAAASVTFANCQLNEIGEMTFEGEASGVVGTESVSFPSAFSASVLVVSRLNAPPSNIVTWRLGTNTAGVPGEAIQSGHTPGIFAFRGANNKEFSKYGMVSGSWVSRNQPTNGIEKGGSMTIDNSQDRIYALEGNSKVFYTYVTKDATNAWSQLAQTSDNVGEGGAVQFLEVGGVKYVFALLGGSKRFRRYNVASDTWTSLQDTPENIKKGGALTTDGTYLYALRGDGKKDFYRYNITANTWSSMASLPENIGWGGSLTRIGNFIYALRGDGKKSFYRYDIDGNSWTAMKDTPGNVGDGGALTNDGTFIYALQGKTLAFWKYDPATDTWSILPNVNFTGNVGQGGALVYDPGRDPKGLFTVMRANRSLVSTGDTITITYEATNNGNNDITGIVPSAVTVTPTGGATAALISGPVPASLNLASGASGSFTWKYVSTAGTNPGTLTFSANATYPNNNYFPVAVSRSVIVSPPLTFQTKIADAASLPPDLNQVSNLAMISDQSAFLFGTNSNLANTTLRRPALTLSKSNSPEGTVAPGDEITYTLTLTNDGTGQATNVEVTDAVPANTTYVGGSCTGGASCGPSGSDMVWTVGDIPAFSTVTLTFKVTANTGLPIGTYTLPNSAAATSSNAGSPSSNTVTNTLLVEPELTIVKIQTSNSSKNGEGIVMPGNTITYTLIINNVSPTVAATTISVADVVPEYTTYVANSCTGGNSCGTDGSGNLVWNITSLAAGSSATLTFQATVDTPNENGAIILNSALLTADGLTPVRSNYVSYTIEASPALAVAKSANPSSGTTVKPYDVITYTLEISNTGDANTDGAAVADFIPAGTTYIAGTTTINTKSVPELVPGVSPLEGAMPVFSPDMGDVDGDGGTLAVGSPATVTFRVRVTDTIADGFTISNQAVASAPGIPDVNSNTVTHTADVDRRMSVVKSGTLDMTVVDPAGEPNVGDKIGYTIVVTNTGNVILTGVTVSDSRLASLTPVWPGVAGSLQPGQYATFTGSYILVAADLQSGSVSNTATGDSDQTGPVQDTEQVTLPIADLTVTKGDAPDPLFVGQELTYTLVVTNNGLLAAANVSLADVPDAVLQNLQYSVNGGAWSGYASPLSLESLPAGGSVTVQIRGTVSCQATAGTIVNTAAVSTSSPESNTGNNTASATTGIRVLAAGPVTAGQTLWCTGDGGYTFSVAPVDGATGYIWSVPAGSVITGGQGTPSIIMTAGGTSGDVCVEVTNGACTVPSCLAITMQSRPGKPVFTN